MTRSITEADIPAISQVASACGLFTQDQLEMVEQMVLAALADQADDTAFWLVHGQDAVKAIAYVEPERMTDGTWNIQLIAVAPESQRSGIGRQLLVDIERELRERGARVVLVDTSATDDFNHVRAFYTGSGFAEEARIREFYTKGVDKIIYRKALDQA